MERLSVIIKTPELGVRFLSQIDNIEESKYGSLKQHIEVLEWLRFEFSRSVLIYPPLLFASVTCLLTAFCGLLS